MSQGASKEIVSAESVETLPDGEGAAGGAKAGSKGGVMVALAFLLGLVLLVALNMR